jgi:hypothetical protein
MDLSLPTAAGSHQRSYSQVRVPRDSSHILLSQIQDSPNLSGQVPVFIYPKTRCPNYTHRHWFLFPSPPTTRRATTEVFDSASTRASAISQKSKSHCD